MFGLGWVFGDPAGGSSNAVENFGDLQSFRCPHVCQLGSSFHSIENAWSTAAETTESVSGVYVIPNLKPRETGTLYFATDDPQTAIW